MCKVLVCSGDLHPCSSSISNGDVYLASTAFTRDECSNLAKAKILSKRVKYFRTAARNPLIFWEFSMSYATPFESSFLPWGHALHGGFHGYSPICDAIFAEG